MSCFVPSCCPVATNNPGPFALSRPAAAATILTSFESGCRSSSRLHVLVAEPEPHVAHLLTVALAIVRQHVDEHERGRPASGRARPRPARAPAPARDAAPASASPRRAAPSSIGSASSSPRRRSTLSKPLQPLLRRLQHRRRPVDRDHARDERRERGADLAGAAAEIADGPRRASASAGERGEVKTIAEQLVAHAIPLAGRRREELLRLRAPLGQRAPADAADPAPPPASARPARAPAARAGGPTASSSSRVIV